MVTARDKLGLLAALIGVAVLLWFGVSHFGGSGAGAPASPPPGQAAAQRATATAYLKHLQRIDAPVESYERRGGVLLHRELAKPGAMNATAHQQIEAIASAYSGAASEVRHVHPTPGFEQAQQLLAKTYDDQSAIYRSVLLLSNGKTVQSDPNAVLDELTRIDNALGAFDNDLTACRTAFQASTATAGVPYPAWVAALINHATGQSSAP
jgi:hypothetical protein